MTGNDNREARSSEKHPASFILSTSQPPWRVWAQDARARSLSLSSRALSLSLAPPHALSPSPSLSLLYQEDAADSVTLFGVLVICPANLLTFLRDSERLCLLRSNNIITSPPQVGYPYSLTTASPAICIINMQDFLLSVYRINSIVRAVK